MWQFSLAMSKKKKNGDGSTGQTMIQLERLARLVRSASQTDGLYPVQWEALRYLSRANRFSNSPHAMARYLGSTKGTISQTVLALTKKNMVEKTKRPSDSRSIVLRLTVNGQEILTKDPLKSVEESVENLGDKTAKRFSKAVEDILHTEVQRQNEPSFGTCHTCRFLRGKFCKVFRAEIETQDFNLICLEHSFSD